MTFVAKCYGNEMCGFTDLYPESHLKSSGLEMYIYVCGISKIWFSQLFQFQPFNTGVYDLFWVGPTNQQTGVQGQYNTTRKLMLHVSWRQHFLILRNIGWIKLNLSMPHNSPCLKIHYWEPWEWWVVPKSGTNHTYSYIGID